MPPYAQPTVLPTDANFSSAAGDSTTAYKSCSTALLIPLCYWRDRSQPAHPNRNPIYLTASAANASGSVQTTLSKLPRPQHLRTTSAPHLGPVPIGIYRLSVLMPRAENGPSRLHFAQLRQPRFSS